MKIKLCGFRDENSLAAAIQAKCDFLGFIFYEKSIRNISVLDAKNLAKKIPNSIAKVAVVVDSDIDFLKEIYENFTPDFFQFHGEENIFYLKKIKETFPKVKIIKAFRISKKVDLENVNDYESCVDYFLFDSKIKGDAGGSGKKFDWMILKDFKSKKPWFLSGGLNISNVKEAVEITGARMIDISSGIEEEKGKKSSKLIKEFVNYCHS